MVLYQTRKAQRKCREEIHLIGSVMGWWDFFIRHPELVDTVHTSLFLSDKKAVMKLTSSSAVVSGYITGVYITCFPNHSMFPGHCRRAEPKMTATTASLNYYSMKRYFVG